MDLAPIKPAVDQGSQRTEDERGSCAIVSRSANWRHVLLIMKLAWQQLSGSSRYMGNGLSARGACVCGFEGGRGEKRRGGERGDGNLNRNPKKPTS